MRELTIMKNLKGWCSKHAIVVLVAVALAGICFLLAQPTAAQSGTWVQVSTSGPSAREGFGFAYDSNQRTAVLFGGILGSSGPWANDTWEWNGTDWTQVATTGPSARQTAMAYDSNRQVTVLFGGYGPSGYLGDTWEWNGTNWTQVATSGPPARAHYTMTYDSDRHVVVMFGGQSASLSALGDTWEWDGTSWTQVASTGPAPRWTSAMVFDSNRHVSVLFGGANTASLLYGDTWEWDGTSWTQVASTGPSPRYAHALAYDSRFGAVVLHGGINQSWPQNLNDTWLWNGTAWEQMTTGPSRHSHMMIYDSRRGGIILFGGRSDAWTFVNETWELFITPSCSLDLTADYTGGTLDLTFTMWSPEPAKWKVAYIADSEITVVHSMRPAIYDPPVSIQVPILDFPQQGTIGFLTTLSTPNYGVICSDTVWVDTGPPQNRLSELRLSAIIEKGFGQ